MAISNLKNFESQFYIYVAEILAFAVFFNDFNRKLVMQINN